MDECHASSRDVEQAASAGGEDCTGTGRVERGSTKKKQAVGVWRDAELAGDVRDDANEHPGGSDGGTVHLGSIDGGTVSSDRGSGEGKRWDDIDAEECGEGAGGSYEKSGQVHGAYEPGAGLGGAEPQPVQHELGDLSEPRAGVTEPCMMDAGETRVEVDAGAVPCCEAGAREPQGGLCEGPSCGRCTRALDPHARVSSLGATTCGATTCGATTCGAASVEAASVEAASVEAASVEAASVEAASVEAASVGWLTVTKKPKPTQGRTDQADTKAAPARKGAQHRGLHGRGGSQKMATKRVETTLRSTELSTWRKSPSKKVGAVEDPGGNKAREVVQAARKEGSSGGRAWAGTGGPAWVPSGGRPWGGAGLPCSEQRGPEGRPGGTPAYGAPEGPPARAAWGGWGSMAGSGAGRKEKVEDKEAPKEREAKEREAKEGQNPSAGSPAAPKAANNTALGKIRTLTEGTVNQHAESLHASLCEQDVAKVCEHALAGVLGVLAPESCVVMHGARAINYWLQGKGSNRPNHLVPPCM